MGSTKVSAGPRGGGRGYSRPRKIRLLARLRVYAHLEKSAHPPSLGAEGDTFFDSLTPLVRWAFDTTAQMQSSACTRDLRAPILFEYSDT